MIIPATFYCIRCLWHTTAKIRLGFFFIAWTNWKASQIGMRKIFIDFYVSQTLVAGLIRSGRNESCAFLKKENLWHSFLRILYFIQSKEKTEVTLSAFRGIFVPRQKTCQIKAWEHRLNKDPCIRMQMYIEPSWGEKWQNWKIVEFGSCRRSKILILTAKFDEFCKRKFDTDQ